MANETAKGYERRREDGWFDKYLVGNGLDIGSGSCPITSNCFAWDVEAGDAQVLKGLLAESFDWVYSSHCLEHMRDPQVALKRWWEVLRPGGFLIIAVPDEDLYEQGHFPSCLNPTHKTTWTIHKDPGKGWSPVSHNLKDDLEALPGAKLVSIKLIDTNYDYSLKDYVAGLFLIPRVEAAESLRTGKLALTGDQVRFLEFQLVDQTTHRFNAEAQIEAVVQKAPKEE